MSGGDDAAESEEVERCDYCRLPVPSTGVHEDHEGVLYTFCSRACREAMEEHERTFTEYHGFRRFESGVSALDSALPQGVPRNSFVLLSAHAGTRMEALSAELVWRTLERGQQAVFVTFLEPPVSVVQQFVRLDWNVLPYLESGQLEVVDCFTYRLEDRDRMYDRMNDWNRHLQETAADATTVVQDPTDTRAIASQIDRCLSERDMRDAGVVVIDSLTELGSLVQPVQAYDFVKDLRADVCKGRFVPIFAGATLTDGADAFPHDLDYIVDGVVEMQLNDELVEQGLVKRIRARKMSGVLTLPSWVVYEYTRGEGLVPLERGDAEDTGEAAGADTDVEAERVPDEVPDVTETGGSESSTDSEGSAADDG